jgi:hypothetical protein
MAVQRALGATWCAVHGPTASDALVRWLLESGFHGLVAAPAPRPLDWRGLVQSARDKPLCFPAVRVHGLLPGDVKVGLASTQKGEVAAARLAVQRAIALSDVVGTHDLILDLGIVPLVGDVEQEDLGEARWTEVAVQALVARRRAGRDYALDRVCRGLFDLCRAFPDKRFHLTACRSLRAVLDLEALQHVYEDLSQLRLGYWHDTAIAQRRADILGEPQGAWLDAFSNRLSGITLGDASDDGLYLPPGSGGVDYPLLDAYLPRAGKGIVACLELDPAVSAAELPGVRSCLEKFGL